MLDALVAATGVANCFAEVISVDRAKAFKPDPATYALVESVLGVNREEVLFVSSNGFDVAGAKRFGFRVAWIERSQGRPGPAGADIGPAEFYRLIRGGEEELGHQADYRVARLTDIAPLLAGLAA
jgi:2-haloacid dehalogenase